MAQLKTKSEENIEAAKLLIENELWTSSIHCSYYSCFQIVKHIICHKLNISYKKQDEIAKDKKIGSHNYLLSSIKKKLKSLHNISVEEQRHIANSLSELKTLRIRADYRSEIFDKEKSTGVLSMAEETITIMSEKFEL